MRLAFGAFTVAFGYAMVYYAAGLFRNYKPSVSSDPANVQDLTFAFSYLLGFPNNGKFGSLPFKPAQTGTMSATTPQPSGATPQKPGGGVQLV